MKINPFPRLRQSCRRDHRGPAGATPAGTRVGQGPSAAADALSGHPSSLAGAAGATQGHGLQAGLNRVYLSGVLAADPQRDRGRDGEPVALLLVAFPAPDDTDTAVRPEIASCEVEVPGHVAEVHSEKLRAGRSIFIAGQLSGGGGVIATRVRSGPPPAPGIS
jgi:Single-strand binding protein family